MVQRFSIAAERGPLTLARVLAPERVVLLGARTKQDALAEMVAVLSSAPEVGDAAELRGAIAAREELLSTGIGLHIGVPHVRLASVADIVMAVGLARHGIADYESIDGLPVYLIFAIAARTDQHTEYIQLLVLVSRLMREPGCGQRLLTAETAMELHERLLHENK